MLFHSAGAGSSLSPPASYSSRIVNWQLKPPALQVHPIACAIISSFANFIYFHGKNKSNTGEGSGLIIKKCRSNLKGMYIGERKRKWGGRGEMRKRMGSALRAPASWLTLISSPVPTPTYKVSNGFGLCRSTSAVFAQKTAFSPHHLHTTPSISTLHINN